MKHYEQTTTKQHAAEITKTRFKKKPPTVDQILSGMTEEQREISDAIFK